jgi:hypothetical protein
MRGFTAMWGDGEYTFRLRIKEIKELQLSTGVGLGEICRSVISGWPDYVHLYELIRLALIGGGVPAVRAKQLVEMYVDDVPMATPGDPASPIATGQAIVQDLWFGPQGLAALFETAETDSGKDRDATMEESTSRPSTVKARASAGRRRKSTK